MTFASLVDVLPRPAPPDSVRLHFARRGYGLEYEMEVRWIERHVPREATRIVEIGCGNGRLMKQIGLSRTLGIDFSSDGLAQTQKKLPRAALIAGTANAVPIADAAAEVVVVQHVIEHLNRGEEALREWSRILSPGGWLILITPNRTFRDPSVYDDPTHVRIFTAAGLEASVTAAGFRVTELVTLGLPWFRRNRRTGMWRFRRWTIQHAARLACWPLLRRQGQSLCCAAQKPR